MLEVTMNDLLNSNGVMRKLATKDLPIKIAYSLSRIISKTESELKIFDNLKRDLFKKYGEETKDKQIKIKDEHREVFQKEIKKLLDIKVEVYGKKVKLESLRNIELSAIDIINLGFLIEEEIEEVKPMTKEEAKKWKKEVEVESAKNPDVGKKDKVSKKKK